MKAWIVAILIALLPVSATAATRAEIRKQFEYSMLVKGEVETNAEGGVSAVTVDRPDEFPPGLVDYVKQRVSNWKFEPVIVSGKPVRARSSMSLLVVAKRLANHDISIHVRNVSFGGETPKEGEILSVSRTTPPLYPKAVAAWGVSGTVYLVLKVGADGELQDAMVEKVNLRTLGKESAMESWRAALSDAALKAVREWTFVPPTKGALAKDDFWFGRASVIFEMKDAKQDVYGKWRAYIPGPTHDIPWVHQERREFSPDSLADGDIHMLGRNNGPKLLTALDGS